MIIVSLCLIGLNLNLILIPQSTEQRLVDFILIISPYFIVNDKQVLMSKLHPATSKTSNFLAVKLNIQEWGLSDDRLGLMVHRVKMCTCFFIRNGPHEKVFQSSWRKIAIIILRNSKLRYFGFKIKLFMKTCRKLSSGGNTNNGISKPLQRLLAVYLKPKKFLSLFSIHSICLATDSGKTNKINSSYSSWKSNSR